MNACINAYIAHTHTHTYVYVHKHAYANLEISLSQNISALCIIFSSGLIYSGRSYGWKPGTRSKSCICVKHIKWSKLRTLLCPCVGFWECENASEQQLVTFWSFYATPNRTIRRYSGRQYTLLFVGESPNNVSGHYKILEYIFVRFAMCMSPELNK